MYKRLILVDILAVCELFIGVPVVFSVVREFLFVPDGFWSNVVSMSAYFVLAVCFVVSAIALWQYKQWAPKLFLSLAVLLSCFISFTFTALSVPSTLSQVLYIFAGYWMISSALPLFLLFFYFSRPKVKERFKRNPDQK